MDCDRSNRCENFREAKSLPVDLGEWRGWKLTWEGSYAFAHKGGNTQQGFQPGVTKFGDWVTPECANACLTAYRRAVARGLATWPAEFLPWAKDEIPEDWCLASTAVFLGVNARILNAIWPETSTEDMPESTRRAALLGLCDAKPAPEKSATDQLTEAGVTEVNGFSRVNFADGKSIAYLGSDKKVNLFQWGLPLPRAVAVLRASQETYCSGCKEGQAAEKAMQMFYAKCNHLSAKDNQLAAATAEIARLKGEIAEAYRHLHELAGVLLPHGNDCKTCSDRRAWLARNKARP